MLTFAIDNEQSFKNLDSWKNEFLQYSRTTDANFPFLVVATKVINCIKKKKNLFCSLKNLIGFQVDVEERAVSEDEANTWCSEYLNSPYVETSSKTDMNIETAFSLAVELWISMERPSELKLSQNNLVKLSRPITGSAACPTAEIVSPKCC